jgi:uncharacterized protein (DUF4415 family)
MLKTKLKINKHKLILPTPEEDTLIAKGISEDPDNPEWTAIDFASAKKASEVLPAIFGEKVAQKMLKPVGRPKVKHPKKQVSIRLSDDTVAYFRSLGKGWQTKVSEVLKQYMDQHVK